MIIVIVLIYCITNKYTYFYTLSLAMQGSSMRPFQQSLPPQQRPPPPQHQQQQFQQRPPPPQQQQQQQSSFRPPQLLQTGPLPMTQRIATPPPVFTNNQQPTQINRQQTPQPIGQGPPPNGQQQQFTPQPSAQITQQQQQIPPSTMGQAPQHLSPPSQQQQQNQFMPQQRTPSPNLTSSMQAMSLQQTQTQQPSRPAVSFWIYINNNNTSTNDIYFFKKNIYFHMCRFFFFSRDHLVVQNVFMQSAQK